MGTGPSSPDDSDLEADDTHHGSDSDSGEDQIFESHYKTLLPLAKLEELDGFYFELIAPPRNRWAELYDLSAAMRDWVERIHGEGGCWE